MIAVLSFLTRIPLGARDFGKVADHQCLFPLAGALIGFLVYLPALALFTIFPAEIGALLTLLVLYMVTGLLHLDGLGDFSDGLMAAGDRKRKIAVLKDPRVGTAGVFSIIVVLLLVLICLRAVWPLAGDRHLLCLSAPGPPAGGWEFLGLTVPGFSLAAVLMTSEVSAKLAMNTCIFLGKRAHTGMGSVFTERSGANGYAAAFASAALICLVLAGPRFFVFITGVLAGALVAAAANRAFGGASGDSMGAANEVARAATLLLWVALA
jgi:adenosylcobinamide-GDP ribazoletransferase